VEQAGGVGLEVAAALAAVGAGSVERDSVLVELVEQRLQPRVHAGQKNTAAAKSAVSQTAIWIHIDLESICGLRGVGPDPEENL
jgi:hypothetical protein